jgi:hypothetical protein
MAAPITWQNVAAPQVADISRPLYFAQNAITSGMNAFSDALKQYESGQRDIWKRQDADATQSVLDRIYQAGSVEEFNRLNASGAFNETTAANGARIDRAAVNAVRDPRLGLLQNRELERARYTDSLRQQADAPVLADSLAALANRDFTSAFSNMDRLSPQGRAILADNIDKARQDDITRNRAGTKAADDLLTSASARQYQTSQAATQSRNADTNASLAALRERDTDLKALDSARSLIEEAIGKNSLAQKGVIGAEAGMKAFTDSLKARVEDKGTLQALSGIVGAALKSDPNFRNLPTDVVESIAMSHVKNVGTGLTSALVDPRTSTMVERVKNDFRAALDANSDRIAKEQTDQEVRANLIQQYRLNYDQLQRRVFPDLAARLDAGIARRKGQGSGAPDPQFPDGGNEFKDSNGVSRNPADMLGSNEDSVGEPFSNPSAASTARPSTGYNPGRVPASGKTPSFMATGQSNDKFNTPEMALRASIEQELMGLGRIQKFSPDVATFLAAQRELEQAEGQSSRNAFVSRDTQAARDRMYSGPRNLFDAAEAAGQGRDKRIAELEKQLKDLVKK